MIKASNVSVTFGGLRALDGVNITVAPGDVVGLVGPNGAGKTTLFNCITGLVRPSSGSIHLDKLDISNWPVHRRSRAGIARTFQTPRFDLNSTLIDAVLVGVSSRRSYLLGSLTRSPSFRRHEREAAARAAEVIEKLSIGSPGAYVGELSTGRLRLLEVARAIAMGMRFLLLDEPAAGMDDHDRGLLAAEITKLAEEGIGVLLVEHNFPFVTALCHHIVVLASGSAVLTGTPQEITNASEVSRLYLGVEA